MFYLEDGWVKLYTGGQIIAPVSEIPKLINELKMLDRAKVSSDDLHPISVLKDINLSLDDPKKIETNNNNIQVREERDIKSKDYLAHLDNLDEEPEESDTVSPEDRYTTEGIDRLFRASPDFIVSLDRWNRESKYSWAGISGPDLFNGYQKHAEHYCEGCLEYGREPTYEGFRQWLINLRDQNIGNN